jgi:hypothetical protein
VDLAGGAARRQELAQAREAELLAGGRVDLLGQAVAVEQQQVAGAEGHRAWLDPKLRADAERQRAGPQLLDRAAGPAEQREGVAGADVVQPPGRRVEQAVEQGEEGAAAAGPDERPVEQRHRRLGPRVEVGRKTERGVGDHHQQPGGHAVAAGVAGHDHHPAVRHRQEVVVVAADLVGGPVGLGEAPPGELRPRARQELALEVAGDLQLVAHPHPVDQLQGEEEDQGEDGVEGRAEVEADR